MILAETSAADIDAIFKLIVGSGGALAVLLFGIRWFMADRDKVVAALNAERGARITALEESSKRCSEDRVELHKQISNLQAEVRELLKTQIKEAHACHAVAQVSEALHSTSNQAL